MWILCKNIQIFLVSFSGFCMKEVGWWSHDCLVLMATPPTHDPTHCDITMGVYCDITSLSGTTFQASHMKHFTCYGEVTSMFTIKK